MQRQDSNLRFPAYETGRMTTSILCARNYALETMLKLYLFCHLHYMPGSTALLEFTVYCVGYIMPRAGFWAYRRQNK